MKRILLCLTGALSACGLPSVHGSRPVPSDADDEIVAAWAAEIRARAQHGDWLLTRNYSFSGDLTSLLSFDEQSLTHAALYDRERDLVIEATSPHVQAVSLERFVGRYRRVVLMRPEWLDAEHRAGAIDSARALLGRPYDWAGLFGFDDDESYYCSEMLLDVVPAERRPEKPRWVTPAALFHIAEVVFDGGFRDDDSTRAWARAKARQRWRAARLGTPSIRPAPVSLAAAH